MRISRIFTLAACCIMLGCAAPQKTEEESSEAGDSTLSLSASSEPVKEDSTTVTPVEAVTSENTTTASGESFPLDDLRQYSNPEALVEKFGAANVVRDIIPVPGFEGKPVLYLFRGSDREVVFTFDPDGNFEAATAGEGTTWSLKNGLKIGMTMQEVQDLEGSVLAFNIWGTAYAHDKLKDPFSGFVMSLPKSLQGSKDSGIFWKSDQYPDEELRVAKLMCFYYDQFEGD